MQDGRLRLTGGTSVGDIPWKLDVSPDRNSLLVSESGDRTLGVYRIRNDDGGDDQLELIHRIDWGISARDFAILP